MGTLEWFELTPQRTAEIAKNPALTKLLENIAEMAQKSNCNGSSAFSGEVTTLKQKAGNITVPQSWTKDEISEDTAVQSGYPAQASMPSPFANCCRPYHEWRYSNRFSAYGSYWLPSPPFCAQIRCRRRFQKRMRCRHGDFSRRNWRWGMWFQVIKNIKTLAKVIVFNLRWKAA